MTDKKPVLSIGMIVKNEEKKLEKCLRAVEPLRQAIDCELLIADTGSVDGTRVIAEKYADKVIDFPWVNDFSAARNAVLEIASGKWYFWLDADEYLDPDISQLLAFLGSPEADTTDVCTVIQRNYVQPNMQGDFSDFHAFRLLRIATGLKYQGRIHERWPLTTETRWKTLEKVILHHDGYVYETPAQWEAKARRNITLLREELKETPDDGVRILQCMESSGPLVQEAVEFSHLGMDLLAREPKIPHWDELAGPICRKAIGIALQYQMPEIDEWIRWAETHQPDSPFVQIDVSYYHLCWLNHNERYAQVHDVAERFITATCKYLNGDYPIGCFVLSSIYRGSERYIDFARVLESRAALELGNMQEGINLLRSVDMSIAQPDMLDAWMAAAERAAHLPEMARLVADTLYPIMSSTDGDEMVQSCRKTIFTRIAKAFRTEKQDGGWRVYTEIPTDQGRGAQLYAADSPERAQEILNQIVHWGEIPPTVLAHVWQVGAALPPSFYAQSPEDLYDTVAQLQTYDIELVPHTLVQLTQTRQSPSFAVTCFNFALAAAAIQSDQCSQWDEGELYIGFGRAARACLEGMYRSERLENEENIRFLPALHRFAWYFLSAQSAAAAGDWTGCIHLLRQALAAVPGMKNAVQALLRWAEKGRFPLDIAQASPELLELAQKIRAILQQYPADDPAALAIRQSPAYQQVAYLIEEPDTVWPV